MKRKLFDLEGKCVGICKYSKEDADLLSNLTICKSKQGYAVTTYNGMSISVHKLIIKCNSNLRVDHINLDKLDCRRENLRILTPRNNSENRKKVISFNTTSIYKGVSLRDNGKYRSSITVNGKKIALGTYNDEVQAAKAYDSFINEYNRINDQKIYHSLNFIESFDEEKFVYNVKQKKTYSGTSFIKSRNHYVSRITINRKNIFIGSSSSEVEAAKMYDHYIVEHNINRKLNFPNDHIDFSPTKKIKTQIEKTKSIDVVRILNENDSDSCAVIDIDDYDKIKYFKCRVRVTETGKKYVVFGRTNILLHRFLMNAKEGELVDHISGDGLDNRKCNLRISDTEKNAQNRKKTSKKTSSRFIGVSKAGKIWKSSVKFKTKRIHIGHFSSEEKAAKARDKYIIDNLHDQHYKLNFPDIDLNDINVETLKIKI